MANSTNTSQLRELIAAQAQKEVTANANFRASSPANSFARDDIAAGADLSWPYYMGTVVVDGSISQISSGTITNLPPNRTTGTLYLEIGRVSSTTVATNGIISKATNMTIPVASHSFSIGDYGYLSTTVAGMIEVRGMFFKVISGTTGTSIVTDINSTSFTTHTTSTGTVAKVTQGAGTITIGKATTLHNACKPLYSLITNATTITDWTDLRIPGEFIFNNWGTYVPTLTNGTNIASSTPQRTTYNRVGNTVTVAGQLNVTTTATGDSILGISLPISSTISTAYQLGGTASAYTIVQSGGIYGQPTGTRAELRFQSINTNSNTMCFNFTYEVA